MGELFLAEQARGTPLIVHVPPFPAMLRAKDPTLPAPLVPAKTLASVCLDYISLCG